MFLRMLEDCQGIMLLSADHVTQFDPAALSRIHLKVKYDDLKSKAMGVVWENFLARARTSYGDAKIFPDEFKRLTGLCVTGII